MTIKFTGRLTPITENKSDGGKVSINNNKISFKNTKILESAAKSILKNSPTIKNVIKAVDITKDSARIGDGSAKRLPSFTLNADIKPISNLKNVNLTKNIELLKNNTKFSGVSFFSSSQNRTLISSGISRNFIPFFDVPLLQDQIKKNEDLNSEDNDLVAISSSFSVVEQDIFGLESLLMIPLNPEVSEKTTGVELKKWEKPRVVATIAENIRNGYPSSNAVVFKKLTSNRAQVSRYTIYRKSVFKDKEFVKIAELTNEQVSVAEKYIDTVKELGYNTKDVFVFVDNFIPINATYVYKIEVEWVSTGEEPSETFDFMPFLGFSPNSFAGLFISGAV